MDIDTFSRQFADAIEIPVEGIERTTEFKHLDVWDSLCVLTIIAMVDTNYGISVGGNDLEKATTLEDLFNTVCSRAK